MNILKNIYRKIGMAIAFMVMMTPLALVSCSDEPDSENYYTFTGEMMSDYLKSRSQYSKFTEIVNRAGLMNTLSTYGAYTCFVPDNNAVDIFLQGRGKSSVSELSDADCDTIARTHIVNNMYTTYDMQNGVLASANMNRRYIEVYQDTLTNVVLVNRQAHIYRELQNDSVENGVMQPIDRVLESSNSMLPDIIAQNSRVSVYNAALIATGLRDSMFRYKDENYDASIFETYRYISDVNKEAATAPDEHLYGYTAFLVPDDVLKEKHNIPVENKEEALKALYNLACRIYDEMYPDDVNADYHDFDHLTDRRNPLNRFMAYHILDRNAKGINFLTPKFNVGIVTNEMNPCDWYTTMLPYTLMKFENITMPKYRNMCPEFTGSNEVRYINSRYDDVYQVRGSYILPTVEDDVVNDAINGCYFYIDDYVAFDYTMRETVWNCRVRMDFATIFPELMTNDIRLNGTQSDMKKQDPDYDETHKYGRNYYFPDGYLDGVTLTGNAYFVYRRPHDYYWSYEGDEMNLRGNYDFTFRIPPVPVEGDYQVRLGYAATATRGIAQVYFGPQGEIKPQGIPLDMRKNLADASILGTDFSKKSYTSMSDEEKQEDRKTLKNLGYYRGARGGFHYNGAGATTTTRFCDNKETFRIVLCTVHITPGKDYYLRIRSVSSKMGNDNEFMLDYLELVPKNVYGVTDEGAQEDDL